MDLKLNNKYALVCGSTAGIGKATAKALAEEGVNVTLIARNEDKLKQVLLELPSHRDHNYIVADFSNPSELKQKVSSYIRANHGFHILINNTGGPRGGAVFSAEVEEFESAFTQHLKCNHVLAQTLVPFMKTQCFGRIINVISTSVKQPLEGLGVSNTIRGAVANWSKTLANELGEFGITVNNVLPGATGTERLAEIIKNKSTKTGKSEEEAANAMKQSVPAKRFARPEELAYAITFLASECASYINGINLPVDGGRTKSCNFITKLIIMSKLYPPINFKAWIDENRHLLKPPVGNKVVWKNGDFIVMVVGGPNSRKDYHYNETPEFFYQVEGDIVLKVIDKGTPKDIHIREGEIFLLPPKVPHSPQRGANTVGLVIEYPREKGVQDALLWFCENCTTKLYEEDFTLDNIETDMPKIFDKYYGDTDKRSCPNCGEVMQPPKKVQLEEE